MTIQSKILGTLRYQTQTIDWDQIYTLQLPRVYNFFLYKVGDRASAQDLTATTFERAWKARHKYCNDLSSPSTWLFGFARNVLKEHLRQNRKDEQWLKPISDSETHPSDMDIEHNIQQKQSKERLQNLLLELSERERDLIALKYGAGLNNREVATIMGLSESNVGTVLHRTVKQLRQKWDDDNG